MPFPQQNSQYTIDDIYALPDISVICSPEKLTGKGRITVYTFELEDTAEYTFADCVKAGIYEDLEINFRSINLQRPPLLISLDKDE